MLYLKLFLLIIRQHAITIMSSVIIMIGSGLILMHERDIKLMISTKMGLKNQANGPYFFAVVEGRDTADHLRRKLLGLPGVEKVALTEDAEVREQVESFLSTTSLELDLNASFKKLMEQQTGVKVTFQSEIDDKSIALIRDFTTKVLPVDKGTLGPVVDKRLEQKSATWVAPFLRHFRWIVLGLMLPPIYILMALMAPSLRQAIYLYNRYQRKKVNAIVFSFLMSSCLIAPFTTVILLDQFYDVNKLLFVLVSFLMINAAILRSPDWRKT